MKDKIFKLYSNPEGAGWKGWIEVEGMCVAFVGLDDKIVWTEDLGLDPADTLDKEPVPPVAVEQE